MGILAALYVGLVVQSSFVSSDLTGVGRPFLPAALLVLIAACCETSPAILWSGLLGLALDGMSTERLGVQLALASLLGLGLQLMQPKVQKCTRVTLPFRSPSLTGRVELSQFPTSSGAGLGLTC